MLACRRHHFGTPPFWSSYQALFHAPLILGNHHALFPATKQGRISNKQRSENLLNASHGWSPPAAASTKQHLIYRPAIVVHVRHPS
jgi:hypothetical protein